MTDFFSVESNLEQVLADASKWAENVDVSPALEKSIPVIFTDMAARFEAEGYGKWKQEDTSKRKPNQPGYRQQKARDFAAGRIDFNSLYRRTGALFRSLTSRTQNTDVSVGQTELRLGSNLGYARYLPGLIDLSPESQAQIGLLLRDEMQQRFNGLGIGTQGGAA